jgi:hypothetical protein
MIDLRKRILARLFPYSFLMNPLFNLEPVCAKNKVGNEWKNSNQNLFGIFY